MIYQGTAPKAGDRRTDRRSPRTFDGINTSLTAVYDRSRKHLHHAVTAVEAHHAIQRLRKLARRGENWDGRGSAATNLQALEHSVAWIDTVIRSMRHAGHRWVQPHVGLDEDGIPVLEWWNGAKKLTIYVGPTESEYVCSWGVDLDQHMDQGTLGNRFLNLWQWLLVPIGK